MTNRGRVWTALLVSGALSACAGGPTSTAEAPVVPVESLPVLTTLTVVTPSDSLAAGQAVPVSVTALDHKSREMTVGFVTWTSSNPQVARFAPDGQLLCLAAGTTTISATVGQVTGRRVLSITPQPPGPLPVKAVVVSPLAVTLDVGLSREATALLKNFAGDSLTGREITWTTSNDSIAIVSSLGIVTARGPGVAIIEAISENQRGAMQVSVPVPVDSSILVTIAAPVADRVIGDTITVIASVRSQYPLVSVTLVIGNVPRDMVLTRVGALQGGLAWAAFADISSLPTGVGSIVVTAIDSRGARGVSVIPFMHDGFGDGGGSKPPIRSK